MDDHRAIRPSCEKERPTIPDSWDVVRGSQDGNANGEMYMISATWCFCLRSLFFACNQEGSFRLLALSRSGDPLMLDNTLAITYAALLLASRIYSIINLAALMWVMRSEKWINFVEISILLYSPLYLGSSLWCSSPQHLSIPPIYFWEYTRVREVLEASSILLIRATKWPVRRRCIKREEIKVFGCNEGSFWAAVSSRNVLKASC